MAPPFVHVDLESRISRRARIITVTVFVADFAVLAVNHKLAFLIFGDIVYPAPKTAAARGLNRTLAARRTAPAPLI